MTFDEWKAEWWAAFKAAGHEPELDKDGEPDSFFRSGGHHNGPGCRRCGWSCCMHCTMPEKIPACSGHKQPEPPSVEDTLRAEIARLTRERDEAQRTLRLVRLRASGFVSEETRIAIINDIDAALSPSPGETR
jgi:hypothetical protein